MTLSVRRGRAAAIRRLALLKQVRSLNDALLLVRILAFAALVPRAMRSGWVRARARPVIRRATAPESANVSTNVQKIVEYVDLARAVGYPLVSRHCLTRGLTLYHFLRDAGLDVGLCFGVRTLGGTLAGHCWLMRDGEPFLESDDPRLYFTETFRLPDSVPTPPGCDVRLPGGLTPVCRP
ncbi:MAG: lasso peptide biosynthesis B2 protein [Chloroflexi bacterium]|nr:lasso peptide biosynthesis B2 protein [Chloroflexota bacterium]